MLLLLIACGVNSIKKSPSTKVITLGQVKGIGNWSDFIIDYYIIDDEERRVSYKIRLCDMAKDGSEALIYLSHATDLDNLNYFYPKTMGAVLLAKTTAASFAPSGKSNFQLVGFFNGDLILSAIDGRYDCV